MQYWIRLISFLFLCQKITRLWKTILSGFGGSFSFLVPLPSRALVTCMVINACLACFAWQTKEKEGLLVVYSLLGSEKVRKQIPCTMCCATNRADRPFFLKKKRRGKKSGKVLWKMDIEIIIKKSRTRVKYFEPNWPFDGEVNGPQFNQFNQFIYLIHFAT